MPEAAASDPRKLKPALVMATEIMGLLLEALRQEFSAGRWGAFEAAQGFLAGPAPGWVAKAAAEVRAAPEDDADELRNRLRGAFLDLERACRAAMRLLQEEKRCRRMEVCAGQGLASTESHETNLEDLRNILVSVAPALCEPGLRQIIELAEAPEPPEGSRMTHPAARLAGLLLLDAGRRGASDILAAPGSWVGLVQYRMNGTLVPILELPLSYHRALVARFKGLSGLDITQRKRPQEGTAKPDEGGDENAARAIVRVLPTIHGERLDIHLDGPPKAILAVAELGLSRNDLSRYEALLAARSGLIVHTGLTGTGKTTALLAAAAELARQGRSVFALASRVGLDAPGVSLSTAPAGTPEQLSLLRAIRQRGPDVIVIDELGEADLLREALQAAAGGTLVLAGLPGHGCPEALRRLLETPAELPLLQAGLAAVCGHRLPRRLCSCRKLAAPTPTQLAALGAGNAAADLGLGLPVGCPACLHTGFRGVAPVFELWTMGASLKPLLRPGIPDQDWLDAAHADGMTPFRAGLAGLLREAAISWTEAARWGFSA